jgi:AcrR family transcriptional regulator
MRSVVRTHQGREQRRDELRTELCEAMERMLDAGSSFPELSVERLCQEAGISRGTFYLYFDDKGELLTAAATAALHDLGDTTQFWWHLPPGSTKYDLRDAFRRTFDLYSEHRAVMTAVTEVAAHDAAMAANLRSIVAWAADETAAHIQRGIAEGRVDPHVDPRATADWLCWMFERGLYGIASGRDDEDPEQLLDAITGLVWNSLYRGAAR